MFNNYMASLFSGNAYAYSRSLHQYRQIGINGTQEQVDMNKFQLLYKNALLTLQTDITNFGSGNLDRLQDFNIYTYLNSLNSASLNADNYNTPDIQKLKNYSYDPTTFIKFRNIFTNVVYGLQNAIKLDSSFNQLNQQIADQKATITQLENTQLAEYITEQPKMTNIYVADNVDIQATELLPWFSEYLFQYGPPNGGFDPNLLSIIVDIQIRKGLYTMEEFLATNKTVSL